MGDALGPGRADDLKTELLINHLLGKHTSYKVEYIVRDL